MEKQEEHLSKELERLLQKRQRKKTLNSIFMLIFFILMAAVIIFLIVGTNLKIEGLLWRISILGIILLLYPVMVLIDRSTQFDDQIADIKTEMDLLRIGTDSLELRAEKQFTAHQVELKRYYDQSLNQSKWIFWVGILCLVAGMIIIVITLLFVFQSSHSNNNIIIAITGGVTSILTNFVAVIFLKMYSETVKSLNIFHERLVTTHHLHFGNFLTSKIFNDESLREKTWSELALSLTKEINGNSSGKDRNND